MTPKHPTGERAAAWFHAGCALIGLLHVGCGIAMIWWHGIGAYRHWKDR